MAFLRVKRIRNREYCYLVENRWSRRRGTRQRVKAYLGPVVRLAAAPQGREGFRQAQPEALPRSRDAAALMRGIISGALADAGFMREKNTLRTPAGNSSLRFSLATYRALRGGQEVVLAMNDGYLCRLTVRRILAFDASGDAAADSMPFARLLVDAGLSPPPEMAAALYRSLGR